jgi:DNA-binding NtrC family response regulator
VVPVLPSYASVPAGLPGMVGGGVASASAFATASDSAVAVLDEPAPAANASLAEVAKHAALKAERVAIEDTLQRVHWNRRKAALHLGVSYKTLLNKIKECGISRK